MTLFISEIETESYFGLYLKEISIAGVLRTIRGITLNKICFCYYDLQVDEIQKYCSST